MSATVAAPAPKRIRAAGARFRLMAGAFADADGARLVLCAAPALALLLVWAARDGGYGAVSWLGGGIALIVLAAWVRLVFGPARALGRRGRLALIALGLYVVWSYASVLWAADKGAAMTGSDRALLYLVLAWLFATLAWTHRRLELALTAYMLGVGGLAVAWLTELALGPAPQLLQGGQFAAGLGYHNATAALGTIGALGSILLASSRHRQPLTRAGLAAGAAACLGVSLLAESRGWLYTLPVIVALVIAIAPARGRVLVWSAIPVGCVLATFPWVLHGLAATGSGSAAHQTAAAADVGVARAGLLASLASGALALLAARLERRYRLSRRGKRVTRTAARTVAAAAVLATIGAGAAAIGSGIVSRGWHQFTTDAPVASGAPRFGELGSGRYDFWRVAFQSFTSHPLGGLGQDNFAQRYVAARRTEEEPAWIHSLELRLLAHTGAVGFALFAAFIALALGAYRLAARDADRRLRVALAAALVPLVVWVVHGSVDWLWEIPALSGAAFAFLGAAIGLEPGRERAAGTRPIWALAGAAAGVVLLGSAYVGERALAAGNSLAATRPAAAVKELSLAARLEPLNSAPVALEAGIELRAGNGSPALRLTQAGLRRDQGNWVLWLEDGLAAGAAGNPDLERTALDRAHALDPQEPVIELAQRRAATPHPLTITEAAATLAARARARVAP